MNKFYQFVCLFSFALSSLFSQSTDIGPKCSKVELTKYFPTGIVEQVFSEYHVRVDKWSGILLDLQNHDDQITEDLQNRAAKLSVNPFLTKGHEKEKEKLIHSVLFDYFNMVMKSHGLTTERINKDMMNNIILRKNKLAEACSNEKKSK